MEKQHCKVGASYSLESEDQALHLLENQLRHFKEKAAEAVQEGSALHEFFERKVQKIQKMMQQFL